VGCNETENYREESFGLKTVKRLDDNLPGVFLCLVNFETVFSNLLVIELFQYYVTVILDKTNEYFLGKRGSSG
jgi:hypothetical protein